MPVDPTLGLWQQQQVQSAGLQCGLAVALSFLTAQLLNYVINKAANKVGPPCVCMHHSAFTMLACTSTPSWAEKQPHSMKALACGHAELHPVSMLLLLLPHCTACAQPMQRLILDPLCPRMGAAKKLAHAAWARMRRIG
jgi:hypothetical protein